MDRKATLIVWCALALAVVQGCSTDEDATVRVVFAAGQDISGATQALIDEFNAARSGVQVEFQVMPLNTDVQHDSYVTYLSAQESNIDLYTMDVIWTAEFARAGWIRPLPESLINREEFLQGPIESASYEGQLYAVPWFTDAGVLYYRSDLLSDAGVDVPETWQDLTKACRSIATANSIEGYLWQGARYEGLVCNFLEFLWGTGGSLELDDLTSNPELAEERIVSCLTLMLDLTDSDGVTPGSVLTYKEEDARRLFTEGRALFLRNWPYAWSMAQGEESKVAGRVGMSTLPHAPGETSYSTIGGWNIALSSFSRHPEEALEFLSFITSEHALKLRAIEGGYLPTRVSTYEDPDVLSVNPHYASFFEVFRFARNRPRSPHYPRVSDIIQENVHGALSREIAPEAAAHAIVTELSLILAG